MRRALTIILSLVVLGLLGYFSYQGYLTAENFNQRLGALEQNLGALQTQATALGQEISQVKAQSVTLDQRLATAEEDLGQLANQQAAWQDNFSSLQAQVGQLQTHTESFSSQLKSVREANLGFNRLNLESPGSWGFMLGALGLLLALAAYVRSGRKA